MERHYAPVIDTLNRGIEQKIIKDVSFEAPNSPEIFRTKEPPQIQMNLGINTNKLAEDTYEVVLSITVTAKSGDKTALYQ